MYTSSYATFFAIRPGCCYVSLPGCSMLAIKQGWKEGSPAVLRRADYQSFDSCSIFDCCLKQEGQEITAYIQHVDTKNSRVALAATASGAAAAAELQQTMADVLSAQQEAGAPSYDDRIQVCC